MCSGLEIVTGIRSTISVNVEIPFLICGGEKEERGVGEKRGGGSSVLIILKSCVRLSGG